MVKSGTRRQACRIRALHIEIDTYPRVGYYVFRQMKVVFHSSEEALYHVSQGDNYRATG